MIARATQEFDYAERVYHEGDLIENDHDAERLIRFGVAELVESDPVPTSDVYDPGTHTVTEVQLYVEQLIQQHPDEAQAVLDAEQAGKNRSTLVGALEVMIASNTSETQEG